MEKSHPFFWLSHKRKVSHQTSLSQLMTVPSQTMLLDFSPHSMLQVTFKSYNNYVRCYNEKWFTWYWDKIYSNNNIETMALYFKHQNNFKTLKLMISLQAHIFSRILVIARCGKLLLFPVEINIIKPKCLLTKQKRLHFVSLRSSVLSSFDILFWAISVNGKWQ